MDYETVQEALDALKAKPGVQIQIRKPDAWIIVDGGVYVEIAGLCQASRAPCGELMQEFKDLNQRIGQSTRSAVQKGTAI